MKLLGHPVHVMLIHFPSALFPMDFVCSGIQYYTHNRSFTEASFYAMVGGVLLGYLVIIFGIFDLLNVVEKKPKSVKKALIHGGINTLVVIVYTVLAFIQYKHYPLLMPDGIRTLITKVIIISFMIIGNYIGGSLILKDKIAVENE
jgi:uncharacterized membrane protein